MRGFRKIFSCTASAFFLVCMSACGVRENNSDFSAGGDSGSAGGSSTVLNEALIDVGLDADLLPDMDNIVERSGTVYVDMVFGKQLSGWKAVQQAYTAIQPKVNVKLTNYGGTEYATIIKQELQSDSTNLGIFAGNYVNTLVPTYGYDFKASSFDTKNVYANNKIWRDVLNSQAYTMSTSSTGVDTLYVMNSQSLETCWYINNEAFVAAGIVDESGGPLFPKTWDELIEICARLQDYGYRNPLGLAGDQDAITATQFAWLLRVYGDQYYRDMLDDVQAREGDWCYTKLKDGFELDFYDPQPEADDFYNPNDIRVYNAILDSESTYMDYVGPNSDKYKCFLQNLYKIKPYVSSSFAARSFDDVRDLFLANKTDKSCPVILLDYVGFGLSFENDIAEAGEDTKFTISMFDYPAMTCSHEEKHVVTDFVRDVGGNGGYISLYTKGRSQDTIDTYLDFIKFFMSPYGQSVFCKGMSDKGDSPDGITTVKNVVMPAEWETYFGSMEEKWGVSFNGLCDMNPFQRMYSHGGSTSYSQAYGNYIQKYILGETSLDDTASSWANYVVGYYLDQFSSRGYKSTCYLNPVANPKA